MTNSDEFQKDREVIAAADGRWKPPNVNYIFTARARTRWPIALDALDAAVKEMKLAALKERERCVDILKEITEEWGSGYQMFNEFWARIVKEKQP